MSLASKITFGVTLAATTGVIGWVFWRQKVDRDNLKGGLEYDADRTERRRQNRAMHDYQRQLQEALEKSTAEQEIKDRSVSLHAA